MLDDLMDEGGNNKRVLDLFTRESHHRNITVLTILRNAYYHFVFKNRKDQSGFRALALQAFPNRWRDVLRVFERCTQRPYGYIMMDLFSCVTHDDGPSQV